MFYIKVRDIYGTRYYGLGEGTTMLKLVQMLIQEVGERTSIELDTIKSISLTYGKYEDGKRALIRTA